MKTPTTSSASEVARLRLRAETSVLLVIDIQQKLLAPIHRGEQLVRNAQLLLRLAKILDVPVVVTTQYSKGLGASVPGIASLLPAEVPVIDKQEFSCFGNGEFCAAIKSLPPGRSTLLLCGLETHICVMQSALGALENGYLVQVASDAVGSRTEWNWKAGLERMQAAGALISSTEMMIYELLGGSGTAAFKQMLPYLKS